MNSITRNIIATDWVTVILMIALVLLTVSKYFYKSTFSTYYILLFNNKYLAISKKKGRLLNWFHVLMTVFQVVTLSLFLFLANNVLNDQTIIFYPDAFWVFLIVLISFIATKALLQIGNGYFFQNQTLMADLIFEKLTYFNYSSFIAFLGSILLTYVLRESKTVVYITLFLILIINFIGIVTIVRSYQKLILTNIVYFILYLCALEISPLVIIASYLKD